MLYFSHDDIAQIATAADSAPVGALRLSGDNAFAILAKTTRGIETHLDAPRRAVRDGEFLLPLATFGGPAGEKKLFPCPARFFLMPAPASYTRENVAEIHLPGSPAVLKAALAALTTAGARPAAPGEFTFRAFRNGRLTLAQAEAVEQVVRAGNDAERRLALARLGDRSLGSVGRWRDRLLDIAARLEAALDFAEEEIDDDVASDLGAVVRELDAAGAAIAAADRDASGGLPHVALVGLTNAGKSSLFNRLLDHDAALVSPDNSTTRDSLRREARWHGTRLLLSDNPGHDPDNASAGGQAAARAFAALGGEDLACWVVDAARPLDANAVVFARRLSGNGVVLALNKADLPAHVSLEAAAGFAGRHGVAVIAAVPVSAASGHGVDALRRTLSHSAATLAAPGPFNRRELLELAAARESCRAAADELAGAGRLELAAEDIRRAVLAFSRALGEGYAEDALGRIFSRFCLGK